MALDYRIYDVFTDTPLSGNPLAVVEGADGLDTAAMRAIAREFNLSETVFVLPASQPTHSASVRIFTPAFELPFAGHPTIGTAIALAEARFGRVETETDVLIVLEEKVGAVRCGVRLGVDTAFAEFDLPRLPREIPAVLDRDMIAAALEIMPTEIGFENHAPTIWTAGVPYVCVPVANLASAARAHPIADLWSEASVEVDGRIADCYLYCRDTVGHENGFHARMFSPFSGIGEDPATGSAAAAFAGAVHRFDEPGDGLLRLWIEQGIEMGRPSRIRLEIDVESGHVSGARIGGSAVKVADGRLHL
jgi:trans-2,3-dihydro-3-hydroxyanthranilate isomerase